MKAIEFGKRAISFFYFQTWNFGLWSPPDRKYLTQEILSRFGKDPTIKNVLFVGVQRYTKSYAAYFPNARFITIDFDPKLTKFGSRFHICDDVVNLSRYQKTYFPDGIDLCVLNGVIGYGVNSKAETEAMLSEIEKLMNPSKTLIIGYNPFLTPQIKLSEINKLSDSFRRSPGETETEFVLPFHSHAVHRYSFYTKADKFI
jgi:hypothetical protein